MVNKQGQRSLQGALQHLGVYEVVMLEMEWSSNFKP